MDRERLGVVLAVALAVQEPVPEAVETGEAESVAVSEGGEGVRVADVGLAEGVRVVERVSARVQLSEAVVEGLRVRVRVRVLLTVPLRLRVPPRVPVCEGDGVELRVGGHEDEGLQVAKGVTVAVREAVERLAVAEARDAVGLRRTVALGVREGEAEGDGLALAVRRGVGDTVGDAVGLVVRLRLRCVSVRLGAGDGDAVGESVGEAERVRGSDTDAVRVRLPVRLAVPEGRVDVCCGDAVVDTEGEPVADGLTDGEQLAEKVVVSLYVAFRVQVTLSDAVAESDGGEPVIEGEGVEDFETVWTLETDKVWTAEPDPVRVWLLVGMGLRDCVYVCVGVAVGLRLALDAVGVTVRVAVQDGVGALAVRDAVGLALRVVADWEREGVARLSVGVAVSDGLQFCERLCVLLWEADQVPVAVCDMERVRRDVRVAVAEYEWVKLAVRVGLAVLLRETVGLPEAPWVRDGVAVGDRDGDVESVRLLVTAADTVGVPDGGHEPLKVGVLDCVKVNVGSDGVAVVVRVHEEAEGLLVSERDAEDAEAEADVL